MPHTEFPLPSHGVSWYGVFTWILSRSFYGISAVAALVQGELELPGEHSLQTKNFQSTAPITEHAMFCTRIDTASGRRHPL